jgi:endonuclease/exonuclease/phosphatase (EEP) superfamily protein YafD
MSNNDSRAVLELVKKTEPDLFLLLEVNDRWMKELEPLNFPYSIKHPLENTYGIALLSRFELRDAQVNFLVEDDIPSIRAEVVLRSGERFVFYGLHPRPPAPQESLGTTERDAELIVVAKQIASSDLPTVVAGDLNDVAWSGTTRLFQKISETLDPRIGRGLYSSFHAQIPFLRFPLDHVFHTDNFRLSEIRRLPYVGSDHFPIFVNLSLEVSAPATQEEPVSNQQDREEADEVIEEAREKKAEEDE